MSILTCSTPLNLLDYLERLPLAIYNRIYKYTDAFTCYVHNVLTLPITEQVFRLVLIDAFKHDKVHFVQSLSPRTRLTFETLFVKSVKMKQTCQRFPRSSSGRFGVDLQISGGGLSTLHDLVRVVTASPNKHALVKDTCQTATTLNDPLDTYCGLEYGRGLDHPDVLCQVAQDLLFTVIAQGQTIIQHASVSSLPQSKQDLMEFAKDLVECAVPLGFYPGLRSSKVLTQSDAFHTGGAPHHIRQPSKLAFTLASQCGHFNLIADLLDAGLDDHASMDGAIMGGHVHIAKIILDHHDGRILLDASSVNKALAVGTVEVVWWLIADHQESIRTHKAFRDIQDMCATHGQLNMLQYVVHHRIGHSLTHAAMDGAAANGHINVVEWIHVQSETGCIESLSMAAASCNAMDDAAANGHLDIVKFLHYNRVEGCTVRAMDKSAAQGQLDIVMFLHAYRKEGCTHLAFDGAASNGHLEVVIFLHNHRSEACTTKAMDSASMNGHLSVMMFLHDLRDEGGTIAAMHSASALGHLEIFIWLWDSTEYPIPQVKDMHTSAANGHFFIVEQFAMRSDEDLMPLLSPALCNGHLFLAQWIISKGRGILSLDMMDVWARQRFPECADWLCAMISNQYQGLDWKYKVQNNSHDAINNNGVIHKRLWRTISQSFDSNAIGNAILKSLSWK
ncbi:hypothetical protein O5D80_001948 [Batrachochytrium dendrobatidis]|nr:hypothetical protein O5D80_001948 [Batrachochytrium dendrobatidis]